ncbi:unnamed protein product [Cuscuta epithymum]|uniref:DUF4283 domain-containing protein n=1 Tax=Cuscuta epithymum TaxID=186058 RepID=A0AAV0FU22_9ASTE|nr:unnamed protein product [Cuscuta epithymum]CAH9138996.1 unnamed protein product [Cuscuta epithymum]
MPVPLWVALNGLPIHLHDVRALFSIVSLLGRLLQIDNPRTNFSRPTTTRFCIQLNVSKVFHIKIWIGNGDSGFYQSVTYENVSIFCTVPTVIYDAQANAKLQVGVFDNQSAVVSEGLNFKGPCPCYF